MQSDVKAKLVRLIGDEINRADDNGQDDVYAIANNIISLPEVSALLARLEALEGAVKGLLEYEQTHNRLAKRDDCDCISLSREFEILYETGKCPHQVARAVLQGEDKP